ncbi:Immunoglobulin iota chain, partial [Bos mutus]
TMAWTPLSLLTPLLHCTGFLSQPALTQPPSASASLGASAKLTCTLSSGYSSYYVDWHQKVPGRGPRFLVRVGTSDSDKPQGSGVPSHFSGSKAASANAGPPFVSGLQPEAEADYNCYCPQNTAFTRCCRP